MIELASSTLISVLALLSANTAPQEECYMKIDFDSATESNYWQAVNDGVMGGQSSGGPDFENGTMVFNGVLNTNGGGFSSIRRPIVEGSLDGASGLKMHIKSDGRTYKLSLRTNTAHQDRQVSFQAPISSTAPGKWEEVFVTFDSISASLFGRPVEGAEFDVAAVNSLGIIIADNRDGPFRFETNLIEACQL